MSMGDAGLVDLVCGPASPLPETYQRYRLIARLGSGGQADVYRGVRLCGGVTSAPVTVKVFRIDPRRPLADELRSWDKGDAALMDLNNRGVTGICRRADGFYGPPPHPSGTPPNVRDAVPYQIYDYLHGINLREYVTVPGRAVRSATVRAGRAADARRHTLRALHLPAEPGACAVLHMDIKPSNVMVLTNGDARLIDFTGARYWRHEEITQIAYTPESGGPEALDGQVGPSYDVHGLGAVAFFMLTGTPPRGSAAPPMDVAPGVRGPDRAPAPPARRARRFTERPADHDRADRLGGSPGHARPDDRRTRPRARLVRPRRTGAVRYDPARAVGRARPVLAGTETDAFARIELLERELVALRANMPTSIADRATVVPAQVQIGATLAAQMPPPPPQVPVVQPPAKPGPVHPGATIPDKPAPAADPGAGRRDAGSESPGMRVGRAAVPTRSSGSSTAEPEYSETDDGGEAFALVERSRRSRWRSLKRGGGWTIFGATFALVCWIIWAVATRSQGVYVAPSVFLGVLAVAAGLFMVLRLLGRMVIEGWMHRERRGAILAHLAITAFLVAVGVTFLQETPWVMSVVHWFGTK